MHSKMVLQIALCGIFAQICAKMTIVKVEDKEIPYQTVLNSA